MVPAAKTTIDLDLCDGIIRAAAEIAGMAEVLQNAHGTVVGAYGDNGNPGACQGRIMKMIRLHTV